MATDNENGGGMGAVITIDNFATQMSEYIENAPSQLYGLVDMGR